MNINTKFGRLRNALLRTTGCARFGLHSRALGAGVLLLSGVSSPALAFNIYDGSSAGNNLEINLTTTLSYTGDIRVNSPSKILTSPTGNANGSEGDLAFQHGIVGNLFEAVPELDIKDGNYGAHFSGEAYVNTVYLHNNQNDQPGTFNPLSTTNNQSFTTATRNVEGLDARLLDAFVYGSQHFGDGQTLELKVGQQTLLWGQSLFFAENGIAAGQAPLDLISAQNLINPEAQQVFLPVGQAVVTYRPGIGGLTFQGYYQYNYQHDNFQGVGGYFSSADYLDKGGQRVIAGPGAYLLRVKDLDPERGNGQFGFSVQDTFANYDVGLFGLRFDSKTPAIYAYPGQGFGTPTPGGIVVGNYRIVYPRDIQLYGASVSTTIGPANVAGEISGRIHQNLVTTSFGVPTPANPGNANSDPLYPVGDTVAAQVSSIYISPGIPFDPGGVSILGEVAFNHVVSVTANKNALAPGLQASAAAFEAVITPTYYNVLPNLQVTFPVGITYNFLGRSEVAINMYHGTGSVTFGVSGTYKSNWIATLTYADFFGSPNPIYNPLADRGYVSLNLQHTF